MNRAATSWLNGTKAIYRATLPVEILFLSRQIEIYIHTLPAVNLAPPEFLYIISNILNKTSKSTDKLYIFGKWTARTDFPSNKIVKMFWLMWTKFGAKKRNFKTRFSI